jgi:hypothetical protein
LQFLQLSKLRFDLEEEVFQAAEVLGVILQELLADVLTCIELGVGHTWRDPRVDMLFLVLVSQIFS